jgi:hypothetical protein
MSSNTLGLTVQEVDSTEPDSARSGSDQYDPANHTLTR